MTADESGDGHFYVSDTGNRRVLRYNLDGSFDQVVNQTDTLTVGEADSLVAPGSISAGTIQSKLYLYVADPAAHLVLLYRFQR